MPAAFEPREFDEGALRHLPSLASLASDPIEVDPLDPDFAAPALTNQWAGVMAGRDVLAYAGLSAPGLYHEGPQAELFVGVDGEGLEPAGSRLGRVTYRWEASRIERSARHRDLTFSATTRLAVHAHAVLTRLELENAGPEPRRVDLFLRFLADVRSAWETSWPPADPVRARIAADPAGDALRLIAPDGSACAVAGANRPPESLASFAADDPRWEAACRAWRLDGRVGREGDRHAVLHYRLELAPGERATLELVHALAPSLGEARALHSQYRDGFAAAADEVEREWEREWRAAFTPGAGRYSGHLPVLTGGNARLRRLYYTSVLTLLYCKRTARWGRPGWVYATGFPSSSFTFPISWAFPWDAKMVAGVLSVLDPAALRQMLEAWLEADLREGCAIDFLSGRPVGFWYAVNDYALVHMVHQYLRYTGDRALLRRPVRGRPVLEHLVETATHYRRLAGEDGLADYGTAENLLECVSSYTHKVASFNAANAWNLRTVADLLELEGDPARAASLRLEAQRVVEELRPLYVEGEGFWACKQPDGRLVPVRHCLDFFTVLQCVGSDLSDRQREEMVGFFLRELKTETWMHALSPLDPNTAHSSRTDHQDEGAYTTWPAYCLEVLVQTGHLAEALAWIGDDERAGLADVTRQGPFGQAYCHGDEGSPRFAGAGAKAPMETPHIEKPVLVSGGKYAQVILEALAGLDPTPAGVRVDPQPLPFALELSNLRVQGQDYRLAWTPADGG